MKKILSLILATFIIVCLAMTSVFAEDKVVRLNIENAAVLEGSKSAQKEFDLGLVGEGDLGKSIEIADAEGDSNIKILGEVDLSLYKEIIITYGNDGPTAGPAIEARQQTIALKVNDTVVGASQIMPAATGWTSAEVATVTFKIDSKVKGEVVIAIGNACTHGIAFYEATFVEKGSSAATSNATAASSASAAASSSSATQAPSSSAAVAKTSTPLIVKSSSPAPSSADSKDKNSLLMPIIIGSVVVVAGVVITIIVVKKKKA